MELTYAILTRENIDVIKDVQRRIFPGYSFGRGYEQVLKEGPSSFGNVVQDYFLVYADGEPCGIYGLYIPEGVEEHRSIWLDWYGILPDYRGQGLGKKILLHSMENAKEYTDRYGVLYFRLHTNEVDCASALPLYNRVMSLKEYYKNEEIFTDGAMAFSRQIYLGRTDEEIRDILSKSFAVFSKSLYENEILIPWENRYLNLRKTTLAEDIPLQKCEQSDNR